MFPLEQSIFVHGTSFFFGRLQQKTVVFVFFALKVSKKRLKSSTYFLNSTNFFHEKTLWNQTKSVIQSNFIQTLCLILLSKLTKIFPPCCPYTFRNWFAKTFVYWEFHVEKLKTRVQCSSKTFELTKEHSTLYILVKLKRQWLEHRLQKSFFSILILSTKHCFTVIILS